MRDNKREKKSKPESNKSIAASVNQEIERRHTARSASRETGRQTYARDKKSVKCESPFISIQSGMDREIIWVKRIERWGCSDCAWAYNPTGSPFGETIDEMMVNFVAKRDKEYVSHACAKHPRTQPPLKNRTSQTRPFFGPGFASIQRLSPGK